MFETSDVRNQVISRRQAPTAFAVHQETKVLRMIVPIVDDEVEVCTLEHLLQITGTCQTLCQRHQCLIVKTRLPKIAMQQPGCRCHVHLSGRSTIEPADTEPSRTFGRLEQMGFGHVDAGTLGQKRHRILEGACVRWICRISKFNQPRFCAIICNIAGFECSAIS